MKKNKTLDINSMHGVNKLLLSKVKEGISPNEYLGPDGSNITDIHNKYLQKCQEFKAKAKKHSGDNARLQKTVIHKSVQGYEPSKDLDREIFEERSQNLEAYLKLCNQTIFSENPDEMYENFEAKTKSIRIIRDIQKERQIDLSENVAKEKHAWFTRHKTLSKFIQAVRSIIIKNRLEKRLTKLKNITQDDLSALKDEKSIESMDSKD